MKQIWAAFESGRISSTEAFRWIGELMKTASDSEKAELMKISDRILDREVPMAERDAFAEEVFSARTKKEEE